MADSYPDKETREREDYVRALENECLAANEAIGVLLALLPEVEADDFLDSAPPYLNYKLIRIRRCEMKVETR